MPDEAAIDGPVDALDGRVCAIVLAGGSGQRFGGRPKQFERVDGQRMIDRTVGAARRTCDAVVVVLPPGLTWDGEPVDAVATGGAHQAESLRAGLAVLPPDTAVVVIADPAHPLAPDALFVAVVDAVCAGAAGAVPGLALHDVLHRVDGRRAVATVPKSDLVVMQTPQAFRADVLIALHADGPYPPESSGLLLEHGHRVDIVPGSPLNLHVTDPSELAVVDGIARGLRRGGDAHDGAAGAVPVLARPAMPAVRNR